MKFFIFKMSLVVGIVFAVSPIAFAQVTLPPSAPVVSVFSVTSNSADLSVDFNFGGAPQVAVYYNLSKNSDVNNNIEETTFPSSPVNIGSSNARPYAAVPIGRGGFWGALDSDTRYYISAFLEYEGPAGPIRVYSEAPHLSFKTTSAIPAGSNIPVAVVKSVTDTSVAIDIDLTGSTLSSSYPTGSLFASISKNQNDLSNQSTRKEQKQISQTIPFVRSWVLDNLDPGTEYFILPSATSMDSAGNQIQKTGAIVSFKTESDAVGGATTSSTADGLNLSATTDPATDVGISSVKLHGNWKKLPPAIMGVGSTQGFEISKTIEGFDNGNYSSAGTTEGIPNDQSTFDLSGIRSGSYEKEISSLVSGEDYYFRYVITPQVYILGTGTFFMGTPVKGGIRSFTTAERPTIGSEVWSFEQGLENVIGTPTESQLYTTRQACVDAMYHYYDSAVLVSSIDPQTGETEFSFTKEISSGEIIINGVVHGCSSRAVTVDDSDNIIDPGSGNPLNLNLDGDSGNEVPGGLLEPLPLGGGTGFLSSVDAGTGIPEYINIIIKLAIGILGVLAVIIIIIGGVQYMTESAPFMKSQARTRILNATLGLVLALSIYIILRTINPSLLNLDLEIGATNSEESVVNAQQAVPGRLISVNGQTVDQNEYAIQIAQEIGVDECVASTLITKESGGNPYAVGIDENVNSTQSNKALANAGKTYFNKNIPSPPRNDAISLDTSQSHLGLDWRFSKGIGLLQVTLFPGRYEANDYISNPPSFASRTVTPTRDIDGVIYSPTSLLRVDVNIKAGLAYWKEMYNTCGGGSNVEKAFRAYNGGPGACEDTSGSAYNYGRSAFNIYKSCG
ncbi:MAG: transglycosylase SLT domain-containing protein [Candidatus Nomurabacteria bacterium]|nr:transglycosylase SLT domain-containing protein [Candidatus Nomurabacteria bacterium]